VSTEFPLPIDPCTHECRYGMSTLKREDHRLDMPPQHAASRRAGMSPGMAPTASRYRMDACILEIAALRDREGLQDKDIFLSIGMEQTTFSRKMSGIRKFSVEELGQIADFFSAHTGRPLPGWPFISETTCAIIEARVYGPHPGTQGP